MHSKAVQRVQDVSTLILDILSNSLNSSAESWDRYRWRHFVRFDKCRIVLTAYLKTGRYALDIVLLYKNSRTQTARQNGSCFLLLGQKNNFKFIFILFMTFSFLVANSNSILTAVGHSVTHSVTSQRLRVPDSAGRPLWVRMKDFCWWWEIRN